MDGSPLRSRSAALVLSCLCFAPALLSPCDAAKIRFRKIDIPGATDTYPIAINNHNEVTGFYMDQANVQHGFLRTADGTVTTFDAPGSTTSPSGINDERDIAGSFSNPPEGFIRHPDGTIETFARAQGVFPFAINNHMQTAGDLYAGNGKTKGFLRSKGGRF